MSEFTDGLGCWPGCAEPRNRFSRREPPFVTGPARPCSPSQQAAAEADGAGRGFAFCPDSCASAGPAKPLSAQHRHSGRQRCPAWSSSLFPAVQPEDAPPLGRFFKDKRVPELDPERERGPRPGSLQVSEHALPLPASALSQDGRLIPGRPAHLCTLWAQPCLHS